MSTSEPPEIPREDSGPSIHTTDEPRPTFWHGAGRIVGDFVLPPAVTGHSRSGDDGVHITTDRSLAETYASTTPDATAWVYQVEPVGPVVGVPSRLKGRPTVSYRCDLARIVARFTVSNAVRAKARRAVAEANRMIGETDG